MKISSIPEAARLQEQELNAHIYERHIALAYHYVL